MTTKIGAVAALLASGVLAGCVSFGGIASATSIQDSNLTKAVQASIDQVSFLRAGDVRAQMVNHVIYIHGLVDTYPEAAAASTVVQQAAGATRVVNLVDVANGG